MPYPRNSDLPDSVKNSLPASAQTIFRTAYNSAEEKGWSEKRCNMYAWGAVKNAGFKPPTEPDKPGRKRKWVKMMQIFLSDLRQYELEYEERGERVGVMGLPVLRSGTWRGIPFDEVRLAEIAESFGAIKQADDWMPPVRPRHPSEEEWANDTWDTTQNLGVVETLRYDPDADVLFADIEVDAGTGEKMRGGNVRYVSSEFTDYQSPNTGALYEDAFRGVAFVDNPAVKNIGWLSALNAEEFDRVSTLAMGDLSANDLDRALREAAGDLTSYPAELGEPGPWIREVFEDHCVIDYDGKYYRHDYSVAGTQVTLVTEREEVKQAWTPVQSTTIDALNAGREGGATKMNVFDRVKAVLGLSPEQTEKLDVLEAAEGDQASDDDAPADPQDADGDTPADGLPDVTEQLTALEVRAEAAEKDAKASTTLLQAEISRRHDRDREELLDSLSEDGTLVPAARSLLEPVLRVLEATGEDVLVLQTEEGEVKLTAVEMLAEALRLNASIQDKYLGRSEVTAAAQDGDKSGGWAEHKRDDAPADQAGADE